MKIRIFAHSRSGHHAFIYWLVNQLEGSVIHHNNCMDGWEKGILNPIKGKSLQYGKKPYKHKIYSFEYLNLNEYVKYDFASWNEEYIDILFLRDYYNWLASSYKLGDKRFDREWKNVRGETEIPIIELWRQYAQEFINRQKLKENTIFVKYNDWFKSKNYRKEICDKLNIKFTDVGLNKVSNFGGGSSYSKYSITSNAQNKLKTTQRWKNHKNDTNYIRHIENNMDIVKLNNEIFNMELISLKPLEIKKNVV